MSKDFFFSFSFVIAFQFYSLTCFDILQTSFSLIEEKHTEHTVMISHHLIPLILGSQENMLPLKSTFHTTVTISFSIILFSVSWFFFHLIQYNLVSCFFFSIANVEVYIDTT